MRLGKAKRRLSALLNFVLLMDVNVSIFVFFHLGLEPLFSAHRLPAVFPIPVTHVVPGRLLDLLRQICCCLQLRVVGGVVEEGRSQGRILRLWPRMGQRLILPSD